MHGYEIITVHVPEVKPVFPLLACQSCADAWGGAHVQARSLPVVHVLSAS